MMTMTNNCREKLNQIKERNTYTLVDAGHPLNVFVGLDSNLRKTLLVKSKCRIRSFKNTEAIDVNLVERDDQWILGIHLTKDDLSSMFYQLCDDLVSISSYSNDEENAMQLFLKRFMQWQKLFKMKGSTRLSELTIRGLIGELLFMDRYLFSQYPIDRVIKSWVGTEYAKKDFSIDQTWYEVKTNSPSSNTIKISSISQLDSDTLGFLGVMYLEKMSPESDGIQLKTLIRHLLSQMDEMTQDVFISKLVNWNFNFYDDYDDYVYKLRDIAIYKVEESFPRIKRDTLSKAIVNASYDIDLNMMDAFLVTKSGGQHDT
jgi:hypothetical protein